MKKSSVLLPLILLVCAVSVPQAQEVTGGLEGRVLDSEGEPLAGVGVTVEGSSLQGTRQAVTDARGYFRAAALPVGTYEVTLRHAAHQETSVQDVGVRLGKTTAIAEVRLQVQVLEMPPVVVRGERPLIDRTTPTTGGNLRKSEFETVPTLRNYRSIITLLPQSNSSFLGDETNVSGATGLENMYYIDGINVTEPYRGRTGTNLPYNFVKEIELKRGGYEAEFGRALGGIVNVVTGRGSNEFNGDVFGYYTSDALAGDAELGLLDATIDGFSNYDAGFSVSGPIVRDRLWYFLAYDREKLNQDVEIPGVGFHADEKTTDMYAGKLTWKINDDTDLVFTALGDPTERNVVGTSAGAIFAFPTAVAELDPVLGFEKISGFNLSAAAKTFVGSSLLIEASAAFYDRERYHGGATERGRTEPRFIDQTTGEWSGGYGTESDVSSQRWSVQASATAFLGQHTIKGGFQYEDTEIARKSGATGGGTIRFNGTRYSVVTAEFDSVTRQELPTLFVQDSWRASARLRLNFGLRWDGVSWYGHEGKKFLEFTDQYQPRLGFTYQPGSAGVQQIFGSAGRYYQQYPMNLPSAYFSPFDNRLLLYNVDPREYPDDYYFERQYGIDDPAMPEGDLDGEHSDEFSLGYERLLAGKYKASAIGTYRTLRNAIRSGIDPDTGDLLFGNPGEGNLWFLPAATRDYWSLELAVARSVGPRLGFLASWVISRNDGNAPGLYDSDRGNGSYPGQTLSLRLEEQIPNSSGLLPNDRTHVVKLSGSYRFDHGITLGAFGSWMYGTPLNEFGASSFGNNHNIFLVERGSAGRIPSIWDLNLRLQYTLGMFAKRGVMPRLVVDVLHLGSQQEVVWTDQVRYQDQDQDGNQILPNPNFGEALRYQPPTSLRMGLEISF